MISCKSSSKGSKAF